MRGERGLVDDVIDMPGAQQVEELLPALAGARAEPGEVVIADLRSEAVPARIACRYRRPSAAIPRLQHNRPRQGIKARPPSRFCPGALRFP